MSPLYSQILSHVLRPQETNLLNSFYNPAMQTLELALLGTPLIKLNGALVDTDDQVQLPRQNGERLRIDTLVDQLSKRTGSKNV